MITARDFDALLACCVGRRDDYAVQRHDGTYGRVGRPITYETIFHHLRGDETMGSYVINESNTCTFAVFDSDVETGLTDLAFVQSALYDAGIVSYLERSRRGGHLWVFLAEPVLPACLRAWLLPFCPPGIEFYPKQERLDAAHPYGSLVRVPLGVHRLSGERYPFVVLFGGVPSPLFSSFSGALAWFATVERVTVPMLQPVASMQPVSGPTSERNILQNPGDVTLSSSPMTIREWCAGQDALAVISRYVQLDSTGRGCCPFGDHHLAGIDLHPSFFVYRPTYPDVMCWYCHALGAGGSLFDFLRLYYGLNARDLWHRILSGAQF